MIQLVQPNLDTVGNIGWCLSFVENVFSTPHLGDTATDAWQSTQFPHDDRNFPADVYVPVWFSYFEGGVDYGHVAVLAPDGRVLSSPYAEEDTHVWFDSIDQCASVLNCTYLGWSEDLATVRIVKEIPVISDQEIINQFNGFKGSPPTQDEINSIKAHPDPWGYLNGILLQYVFDEFNALKAQYEALKVLKAQEQATPDVPPAPVVINDPLSPAPAPEPTPTPVPVPSPDPVPAPPAGQGSDNGVKAVLIGVGAALAALIGWFLHWLHN